MTRYDFEDDEELDESEEPDSVDTHPASVDTAPCPICGKQIYEEAQRCPYCRSYIDREETFIHRWRWWMWAGIALALLGSLTLLLF